ncbi:MAG: hypothetical protein ABIG39_03485 [Candidatus Micrarchaeota archaeon]
MLGTFLKWLFGLVAIALIAWALLPFGFDFLDLAKFIAVAVGLSILILVIYPRIRGVKKGDSLLSVASSGSSVWMFSASIYTALENGKIGDRIGIVLNDGTMTEGVVVSYEGLVAPARVRLTKERPEKMNEITVV